MALPLAAIGAAAASLITQASRDQLVKQQHSRQATGGVANLVRQATGTVVGGVVGGGVGATAGRLIGSGNVIPGIPTPSQFRGLVDQTVPGLLGSGRRRGRRMNVANVKALRRAGRRVEGFVRLAKSLVSMPGARSKCAIKTTRRKKRC